MNESAVLLVAADADFADGYPKDAEDSRDGVVLLVVTDADCADGYSKDTKNSRDDAERPRRQGRRRRGRR